MSYLKHRIFDKRKRGFVITIEVIFTMLLFSFMISGTLYIMLGMERQKIMFNGILSATEQASRWGGTNNAMYKAYNKGGMDIAKNMEQEVYRATGVNVSINITPQNIKDTNEKIYATMTWTDLGYWLWPPRSHTIDLETESIVRKGILLNQ